MRGQLKRFLQQHPGQLVIFFSLLGVILFLEALVLPETFTGNAGWFIPIVAAVVLFTPRYAAILVFLTFVVFAIHVIIRADSAALMVMVTVPAFGITAFLASAAARLGFRQAQLVREALDQSPLAYAEIEFPGYRLTTCNDTFRRMTGSCSSGQLLAECLPPDTAARLSRMMDDAVARRERAEFNEFLFDGEGGGETYWRLDIVPVTEASRGTPHAVSLFAFEVTGNVLRDRNRESALRISTAFMSSLELKATMNVVLENMAFSTDADTGILFLLEDEQWVAKAVLGTLMQKDTGKLRIPYDDLWPAVESVLSKHARTCSYPLAEFSPLAGGVPGLDAGSNLVVPLITANRAVGAVWCIQTDEPRGFSEGQVEFATVIGAQAALAIENATIYENERSMRSSLEAIEAISEAGLASLDLEEVLIELVTRTQDVMQMDAAMILLADSEGTRLELRAMAGAVAAIDTECSVRAGECLAGMAFASNAPMKIDDVGDHESEIFPFTAGSGIRSVLAVPLRINAKTAGILQIGSLEANVFSAREWGLIQVLADRASHAVQNSMLHEQTRRELARVALLRDVAAACARTRDLRQIAADSLEAVYRQMGCATAGIFYHDPQSSALVNLAFFGHPEASARDLEVIPLDRDTLLSKAVLERAIITHDNWPDLTKAQAQVLADLGVLDNRRAALPIIYKDSVIGGLALTMPGRDPWAETELDTLKGIANQIAVAMAGSGFPSGSLAPAPLNLND
ncbi:MAG: GAF domain-containing protein [Gaiellales bacterium]|nr:MAG: GAF domain-containing protein [Gaiellales bacterium]